MKATDESSWRRRDALCAGLGLGVGIAARSSSAAWAEDTAKKKGGGISYIQLEPFNVALRPINGRRQILSVECGLDVADGGLRARAQKTRLILRDAFLRWLTVYAESLPPQAPPNPDAIETELQRQTNVILGKPGARFLLGTVMVN